MILEEERKNEGWIPEETDLEVFLINTCKLDAIKIQTIAAMKKYEQLSLLFSVR